MRLQASYSIIFLANGTWMIFFGLIGSLALPYQARGEEKLLKEMFGEICNYYVSKTGHYFPKLIK